ncbi:MAG: TIR domain-containing protein [Haloechinothrix sp.]
MTIGGALRRVHSGSSPDPVSWESVAAIFDACFGEDAHGLPKWPDTMGFISAGWTDGGGRRFTADVLSDLESAYRDARTAVLHFSGHRHEGARYDFEYWPGDPRPRARLAAEGPDEAVASAIAAAAAAFSLPFEGALIFVSWGGDRSRQVAEALAILLRRRFPTAEVFVSSTSIDPGDDPMRRILDDGLLRCQVLIAALTADASQRPWVIWETAAVWAREQLVIPVFDDVTPSAVPGPLTHRVQGIELSDRDDVDRALRVIARRLTFADPEPLSDDEHGALVAAS